jgi:ribA/ribD-fused uncharacterized protein
MPIYFYTVHGPYGSLSNFSPHGFTAEDLYWRTSEHFFQAHKFTEPAHFLAIHRARAPKQAAEMGRDRRRPLRPDWEQVKEGVMRQALRLKFHAHPALRELLLATGDELLIEAAPHDYYWGGGQDGSGKNRLGILLMELREALRAAP